MWKLRMHVIVFINSQMPGKWFKNVSYLRYTSIRPIMSSFVLSLKLILLPHCHNFPCHSSAQKLWVGPHALWPQIFPHLHGFQCQPQPGLFQHPTALPESRLWEAPYVGRCPSLCFPASPTSHCWSIGFAGALVLMACSFAGCLLRITH